MKTYSGLSSGFFFSLFNFLILNRPLKIGAKLAELDGKTFRNILVIVCGFALSMILGVIYSISLKKMWKDFKSFRKNLSVVSRQNPVVNVSV